MSLSHDTPIPMQPPDDVPVPGAPTTTAADSGGAATIDGPYRPMQLLGSGGMGEVWLAEQTAPVHRLVAMKIIKP